MNYIKPLDGLRFLAVTLVLVDHWSGDTIGFPASYLGVCIFFVLSGFLISSILINSKNKIGQTKKQALKRFYIRRTIRIFPLYYLVLFILFILNIPPVRDKFIWLITYTTNIYIAMTSSWLGLVDHLWSLAVEEQYYLFFPFLVLFLPLKKLKPWLFFLIILAVGLRIGFYFMDYSWIRSYVLMPTCLDAFGMGGLLALAYTSNDQKWMKIASNPLFLVISLILYMIVALFSAHYYEPHEFLSVVGLRFFESLFSFFLIGCLIPFNEKNRTLKNIFSWNPLVYIGKISYGIYIFHNFVFNYYHTPQDSYIRQMLAYFDSTSSLILTSTSFKILILYAITVAIASVSWFLFEKPINQLKDKF